MTALEKTEVISIEAYLAEEQRGEVKHEYLGGQVHAMAGGSNRHNTIALNVLVALGNQLRDSRCQPFNSDTKVRIDLRDHVRFYYPDAMVVCQPNDPDDLYQERPTAIVEVLSDSTRRIDLGEKKDAYLAISSLKVLLFMEAEQARVILHRRKPEGGFEIETFSGLDTIVPLPEIGASLSLKQIYSRVEFPS